LEGQVSLGATHENETYQSVGFARRFLSMRREQELRAADLESTISAE
jgi:hypothetical protein